MDYQRKLKFMTHNKIWSKEHVAVYRRMQSISSLTQQHSPGVVFLQSSGWWQEFDGRRTSVSPTEKPNGEFFCLLLSKERVLWSFSKSQDYLAALMSHEKHMRLSVGTCHLARSTPSDIRSMERIARATQILGHLNSAENAVIGDDMSERCISSAENAAIGGDMSWDEDLDGPFPLPSGRVDAWQELRPAEAGYTYDTTSNRMISSRKPAQKRMDRFVCKLKDYRMEHIEMIGLDDIQGLEYYDGQVYRLLVLPSNHHGLLLTISPIGNDGD